MKLSEFDYNLNLELIAKKPKSKRDHSRLLVLNKKNGDIEHKHFFDIIDYLNFGDILVLNNSKVFPARLFAKKKISGGKVEVFLHKKKKENIWECMLGGKNIKIDLELVFDKGLEAKTIKQNENVWDLKFNMSYDEMMNTINDIGEVPVPPYIKKNRKKEDANDKEDYQTVYANNTKIGSVAAPTAGLHFTKELLEKIKTKGVIIKYITLHVGLGTFLPVKVKNIEEHKMHSEFAEISKDVIETIHLAKKQNKKVISVGTTSTRALEAFAEEIFEQENKKQDYFKEVDIFIYPGYKFKITDAMITNFHLPKSSLIMLVSALAGKENIDKAYKCAIKNNYRFYSYGDAMLIY